MSKLQFNQFTLDRRKTGKPRMHGFIWVVIFACLYEDNSLTYIWYCLCFTDNQSSINVLYHIWQPLLREHSGDLECPENKRIPSETSTQCQRVCMVFHSYTKLEKVSTLFLVASIEMGSFGRYYAHSTCCGHVLFRVWTLTPQQCSLTFILHSVPF